MTFFAALLAWGNGAGAILSIASVLGLIKYVVLPVRKGLKRLSSIGDNGQQTLFATLHSLRDDIARHASVSEVIDYPVFFVDQTGRLDSMNIAGRRLTGWSAEDLQRQGWSKVLDRSSQIAWDEAMRDRTSFDRVCQIHCHGGQRIRVRVFCMPAKSGTKFLGWRGSIDRLGDGEDDES